MDDLKPLLMQLLNKVDAIQADLNCIKTELASLKSDRVQSEKRRLPQRNSDWPFEDTSETRLIQEIARLGGRVDQLGLSLGPLRTTAGN